MLFPLKDNVPTRRFPVVTVGLIAANIAVFAWQMTGTPLDVDVVRYGYYPCDVRGPCVDPATERELSAPLATFSAMFMHGDLVHIFGNMLFLWIFGNNVEDSMGRLRYLAFYLLAGIAATVAQTATTLATSTAEGASIPNLGASGAVSGVIGAYFVLLPRAKVLSFIFLGIVLLRELPASFFLGVYFLLQLYEANLQLQHPPEGGGVAVMAHLGGIAFGLALVRLFAKRRPLRPRW